MTTAPPHDLRPTVVHLGPGVFHRAHQAAYAERLLRQGSRTAAIWGVSFRSHRLRDALRRTGGRYSLVERSTTIDGDLHQDVTSIGSVLGCSVLPDEADDVLARLCDPAVTVVSLTVTENGYCAQHPGGGLDLTRDEVVHDLGLPPVPRSVPGLVTAALSRRREAGIAPFTVVSCDNLPDNGGSTRRVVTEFAAALDQRLGDWISAEVSFPSSMVDRIVPSTTQAELEALAAQGIVDPWPVVTEPFTQWVLEDSFPSGRPAWEDVGVELVDDVSVHEAAKLRTLNAGHSALGCLGLLLGHTEISEAAHDPALVGFVRALWACEVLPTLVSPPGWRLPAYAEESLSRFRNAAISYATSKVAGDGSQKLPVRVMPTVRQRLGSGHSVRLSSVVVAAWVAALRGPGASTYGVSDQAADRWMSDASGAGAGARSARAEVEALLAMPGFVGEDRRSAPIFVDEVAAVAERLWAGDVREVLSEALQERRHP
jgi:fructuronate reductase